MAKNYYAILGLNSDATSDQIKSAYRQKVKEFHPDHFGEDCDPFLAIQEAYDVLGDPVSRQAYDEQLGREHSSQGRPPPGFRPEPIRSAQAPVEPLIPNEEPPDARYIFSHRSFSSYHSPFQEIFDRLWDDPGHPPGSRSAEAEPRIEVQVRLTPTQARRGGYVRLSIPVQSRCSTCRGYGRVGPYRCRRCLGDGFIAAEYPLQLSFPPGIGHHQIIDLALDQVGLHNLGLRVHFVIESFW